MIDIFGLGSFVGEMAKGWTDPAQAILFDPISDVENEPSVIAAKSENKQVRWVTEGKMRARAREGWKPFIDRDGLLRPRVFMDRR